MNPRPPTEAQGLIRVGRVSSVDERKHTARVQFTDVPDDPLVSFDFPVLVTRPGDYALPVAGAAVVCLVPPGNAGIGYVVGALYSDADAPPLDDAGQRSVASDDLRLGAPDATDPVALASKVKDDLDALKNHFAALEDVITGPPIDEPGNGAPSALQSALAVAIGAAPYPDPGDVGAEKVKAK